MKKKKKIPLPLIPSCKMEKKKKCLCTEKKKKMHQGTKIEVCCSKFSGLVDFSVS